MQSIISLWYLTEGRKLPQARAARKRFGEWDTEWSLAHMLRILRAARERGLPWDEENTTYFARKMRVFPGGPSPMSSWRKRLFALLHQNSAGATDSFHLPSDRVVEFGTHMRI